ncbi:MAG: hypothetical protein V2A54_07725 [Bacteroidota bacterium]
MKKEKRFFLKSASLFLIFIGLLSLFQFSCRAKAKYGGPPNSYSEMKK